MKTWILSLSLLILSACGNTTQGPAKIDVGSFPSERGQTLECKAYYQAKGAGTEPETANLPVTKSDEQQLILSGEHAGFQIKVNWYYSLTTLYMNIEKGAQKTFSTARVPTQDHNESMIDLTLEDHSRLYVSCRIPELG